MFDDDDDDDPQYQTCWFCKKSYYKTMFDRGLCPECNKLNDEGRCRMCGKRSADRFMGLCLDCRQV